MTALSFLTVWAVGAVSVFLGLGARYWCDSEYRQDIRTHIPEIFKPHHNPRMLILGGLLFTACTWPMAFAVWIRDSLNPKKKD